jgi:hypothetical protein
MSRYPSWDGATHQLSGVSKVVGGETYNVVIAVNGHRLAGAKAGGAKASIRMTDAGHGLALLSIDKEENGETEWTVSFKE